jgi:hypothetical protein
MDVVFAIPLRNVAFITVPHRFGEIRNMSFPYCAVLDDHEGTLITNVAVASLSFSRTAPPWPPPVVGALQEVKFDATMLSVPLVAAPDVS